MNESKPGKTAPRLLQDLLTYDPRYEERAGRNLLTSAPPHHDPDSQPARQVPTRNCRHAFMIKPGQSMPPEAGQEPSHDTIYKVAAFCERCRWHLDVVVDLRDNGSQNTPCGQGTDVGIHHFRYVSDGNQDQDLFGIPNIPRSYRFRCSADKCPVELTIRLHPPRFSDQDYSLLTNTLALRKRLDTAKTIAGDRADGQMARPVDALDYLITYLTDSLNPQKGKGRIPVLNRKFLKTFGRDCDDILNRLGFTPAIEIDDEGGQVDVWHLPKPSEAQNPLDEANDWTIIDDALHELNVLIMGMPERDRTNVRHPPTQPQPALGTIERALGCSDYSKKPMSRTEALANHEDHPYYAGLGAVGDFSDALLLISFALQSAADPKNSTYYFECLQSIGRGRDSYDLNSQVAVLASQGLTDRKDVHAAYKYFGLSLDHIELLSDDFIVSQFRSRLQDISSSMAQEAREKLRIIGHARHSQLMLQEASDAIETYEQALSWLGLDSSQPDDFVVTMFGVKISDNANSRPTARKAVLKIAEERNSVTLRRFLSSGKLDNDMDIGDAYALIGVPDRTQKLDLEFLKAQVESYIQGEPQKESRYWRAYDLVVQDQTENPRRSIPHKRNIYPSAEWPVGCENIGNTCYLNSVLQFLFTIKPLREMVLHCENYFEDRDLDTLSPKKVVGRRIVGQDEVQRAQQFVVELKQLFDLMVHSDDESVKPNRRLAALALSRQATGSQQADTAPSKSHLKTIDGAPVYGPVLNPDIPHEESGTDSPMRDVDETVNGTMDNSAGQDEAKVPKPEHPSRPPPVPPRAEARTGAQPEQDLMAAIEASARQQDAAEILNNIFDLLGCAIKGDVNNVLPDGEQNDLIKQLFFMNVTHITEQKDKLSEEKKELTDAYGVYAGRDMSLYAALDNGFSKNEIENSGKTKYEILETAAPVQIINIKRAVFNKVEGITKDESHIALDEVLYLDRYLRQTSSRSEEVMQSLRKKQWELRNQVHKLEADKARLAENDLKIPLPNAVEECAELISNIVQARSDQLVDAEDDTSSLRDVAEELKDRGYHLRREIEDVAAQMADLDEEINSLFKACTDHPYRLHAIFIHRGNTGGGHYWIYIFDHQRKFWRKYNDGHVDKVVNLDEVFKKPEDKTPATASGVVYVREDLVDEHTEAVRRDPSPRADVEMRDESNDHDQYEDVQILNGVESS
ncbi:cysteine proteinase [Polyplosphaeria fusca]|uniref:ubiquitinyl hydrolase 1 n=1 Tax=Polyplosphaeria fusca TaxID=682080 RepID=A0A9P4R6G6_9PLEO|nr:cysteine proteinase [Polyplosphaeria fusca]